MASWTPTAAGAGFDLSPTLKVLEPFRDSMVVISNLKRAGGQAEMHAAAASGWLSGAVPKRTEAEDLACGTSIDQVLAHPHTIYRGMMVEMDEYRGIGAPIKMSRSKARYRLKPPHLDEHSGQRWYAE